MNKLLHCLLWTVFASAGIAPAAPLALKATSAEPPKELNAAIRARLDPQAVQLLDGDKPVFEFWFVADLTLATTPASPAKSLDTLKQATFLGAVRVSRDQRDYRDDELKAGVYTLRFILQPQDGNHLGTSEHPYYLALTPAKLDTRPDGIADYKALVKASSKETSTDHPLILSLRPVTSAEGQWPRLNEPAPDHKSVRIKLPAKAGAKTEPATLYFELVYHGHGHK
jgi:hypothetical protein